MCGGCFPIVPFSFLPHDCGGIRNLDLLIINVLHQTLLPPKGSIFEVSMLFTLVIGWDATFPTFFSRISYF